MSNTETTRPETSEQGATPPPRKPWRAPEVILAQECLQSAKTNVGAPEAHSAGSISTDS
jgi:hypothetical protein